MTKITEDAKRIIIKKYLRANTLDKIHEETGYSKGSVFNTVKAWRREIGEDNVDKIRRFMIDLNQANISINECIVGFRIANTLKQFNVIDEFEREYFDSSEDDQLSRSNTQFDQSTAPNLADQNNTEQSSIPNNNYNNDIYEFINKIYQGCKNHGIHPEDLVNWAKNLVTFAPRLDDDEIDENSNISIVQNESHSPHKKLYTIPKVSEFSTYIESKKRRIIALKKELKQLVNRKQDLKNQLNKKTEQMNNLSQRENFELQYLRWYSNLRDALKNDYNIDIKQVYGNFAKVIDDFNKYDFDPVKIINDYERMDSLRDQYQNFKKNISIQIDNRNNLHQQVVSLQSQVFHYERTIKKLDKLQEMGFGIKEFEQLSNILLQVASVNKIDKDVSVKKFLKDVEDQYDAKLGFEATVDQLNEEKKNIENESPAYRVFIHTKVAATQSLDYLQSNGVTVFDIIGINLLMKTFLSGKFTFYPTKSMNLTYTQTNNVQSWHLFIDNLKNLKDLMGEINATKTELNDISTHIQNKLAEKQQVDNQITSSKSDLNSLGLQGIHLMNTLNQFSANMYSNVTSPRIPPLVFVNIATPKDSQVFGTESEDESLDKNELKEQPEEK